MAISHHISTPLSRLRHKRLPITVWATVFVVLVCFLPVAIDGWRTWTMRETRLQEAETATSNLARSLAQHADDTIKQADTVLVGLVERVEVGGMSFASLDRLHKLLVASAAELPQLHGLFIFDVNGRYAVDSQETGAKTFNNSDREYFVFHRSHPD